MTKGTNAANYIFWLRELQPTVQETPQNQDKGPKSGGPIALDHVRFSYPMRPDTQVLRGVDLEVRLRLQYHCNLNILTDHRSKRVNLPRLWVRQDAENPP